MAAYAALVSLMNTMDSIQNHPSLSTSLNKYQIITLHEKLDFLLDFVENYNSHGGITKDEVEDLESQITSAAHHAEDVIESHIVDQIHADSNAKSLQPLFDLQIEIAAMDAVKENVIEIEKKIGLKRRWPLSAMPAASSRPLTTGKPTLVGFDSYRHQLLDWLTGQSNQQIIPITGMGGIGKTTLARSVYEDSLIMHHFDICSWVTISQKYNVAEILLELLSCIRGSTSRMGTDDQLGGNLHQILFGRRYLVVLDDMWSIEAWETIKFYFPQYDSTSRIVVTTRQLDVANHCGSLRLTMDFLDDDRSWDLFCHKAFAQESCPLELEEIGKKIVKKCRGLPLSIVVIGGLLGKSSRMHEYWESVEKDISSILNSAEDSRCLNILSLSYNHLPAYLKPCFLYLGIFPEDRRFPVSQLIKLWIAEGFLKPNKERCLEEVAEGYVKDLIDRNLIFVSSLGGNGKLKSCSIHDLVRDLCIKIAEEEKFFCVTWELDTAGNIERERRIVIRNVVIPTLKSTSDARSIIGQGDLLSLNSRLLRILTHSYGESLDTTLHQVNLRFVDYRSLGPEQLPSSISLLWNLQTVIVEGRVSSVDVPFEIWTMPQLRHIIFNGRVYISEPPLSGENGVIVLKNLQTLRNAGSFKCSEEVCKRIPNIKKLHAFYDQELDGGHKMSYFCLFNVSRLEKLESLHYDFENIQNRDELLQNLKFPDSLKDLTLSRCNLHWHDLEIIGSLPNLEVLKLYTDAVTGSEWNPVEGEFLSLKYLKIWDCPDLIYWNADSYHFPVLEKLDLQYLEKLDEIPLGIGNIPTLGDIFMSECSVSAAMSAVNILEEQESFENLDIRVRVKFWKGKSKAKLEEVRKEVELSGFKSHNFQLLS